MTDYNISDIFFSKSADINIPSIPEACSTMRAPGVLSSAIERKRSPRCLQALAIQVDRFIARKSKMATKTIMGFREGLCKENFQIRLSE